jgi:hypothetical protein
MQAARLASEHGLNLTEVNEFHYQIDSDDDTWSIDYWPSTTRLNWKFIKDPPILDTPSRGETILDVIKALIKAFELPNDNETGGAK